ncbi:MAG: glutamyl-tRNA amidotransferase [Candidatus Nealsonbacteria bacterium CG10_big_fil_rev_8_21_14_0_10_40_24]|nr:MAG: glutamyl-tRNA amidotransferase [Candidatus Nealsonbacteria bacterium CG10_big_fil_rev_8_21_14_0_10_40_24]
MNILERIDADLKKAILEKNLLACDTLRILKSEIHNSEIAQKGQLSDEEIFKVVNSQIKRRKEAIAAYEKAGRQDLAAKENQESELLKAYAPQMLSEQGIEAKAKQVIAQVGAQSSADFGQVMGPLMKEIAGKAVGQMVSAVVKRLLGGNL